MIAIEEKVMDSFNENLWPFAKSLAGVALLGWLLGWLTSLNTTAFHGASTIFAMVAYIPYVMYKYARANADEQKFDVEVASELRAKALEQAQQALAQRNKVVEVATAWKEKATALEQKANAIGKECERLRANERTMQAKIQTLVKEIADATQGLADADSAMAKASANAQKAIEQAKANALAKHSPSIKAGHNYLKYALSKSIVNNNTASDQEREEARQAMKEAKALLDAYVVNQKEASNG